MGAEKDLIKAAMVEALNEYSQVDGNKQPVVDAAGHRKLNTNMSATLEVNLDPADDGVLIYGSTDGGATQTVVKTDAGGAIQIDVESAAITSIVPGTGATNLGKAEDAVHASGDVGVMSLGVANEAQATFAADGDYVPIGTDRQGAPYVNLKAGSAVVGKFGIDQTTPGTTNLVQTKEMPDATATFAVTPYISTAQEASAVVKASAGVLYGFVFTNNNASLRYVQVFNSASVPADGAVPALVFPVQPGAVFSFDCGKFGNYFSVGIAICNSTTLATKTLGSADSLFYVQKH